MAKYCVTMMEKTYYELYVEADNQDDAEKKAVEEFGNGGGTVTDSYVSDINVEEAVE